MGLILLDTNILVDHFAGISEATDEIAYHDNIAISAITWTEVAVKLDSAEEAEFDALIRELPIYVLHTDDHIIREATRVRAASFEGNQFNIPGVRKLKTPDAIILATANVTGRLLVTCNPADFSLARAGVRVPYRNTAGFITAVAPPP